MNILGINGLGVVPSACVIANGQLIAFAEEERFVRQKGAFGLMPGRSVKFCLEKAQLTLNDIDSVAIGWNSPFYKYMMPLFLLGQYLKSSPQRQNASNFFKVSEELIKHQPGNTIRHLTESLRSVGLRGELPPVEFVPHHLAHAASAYYTSGFNKAHILVIDGSGENKCTTLLKGDGTTITTLKTFKIPHSLGWFYQSITEFLGFLPNRHEGKLMALASYGAPNSIIAKKLQYIVKLHKEGEYTYAPKFSISGTHKQGKIFSEELVGLLGDPRFKEDPITQYHRDIAFETQSLLEKIVMSLVLRLSREEDYNGNICIAGGVGLNCKMNGKIADLPQVKKIFVPPVANDAGTALGAAMYLSNRRSVSSAFQMEHAYWGPEYSNEQVKKALDQCEAKYTYDENIALSTARLLAGNKIVGWFQGRMEVGSRALGARSILANPTPQQIRDVINEKVKQRELWRPFAASILDEEKDRYVINAQPSPFMTLSFKVTNEATKSLASAIHIDDTIRPQFVTKHTNPRYWKLISEFGKLTGVYAVLNTSFNTDEEPIVCTPYDAIRTFYGSGLDYLVINDYIVYK